jgi:putative redox protein
MAAEPAPHPSDHTLRSVDLHQIGEHRWMATNRRGGGVSIGPGDDPDFTPVELLLAALAGCGAADLDHIAGKRAPFESFRARAEGHKVRDEGGNHMVGLTVTFDVTFAAGEAGDAAREIMPRTVQQIEDRLCTVARTVTLGDPVRYVEGSVPAQQSSSTGAPAGRSDNVAGTPEEHGD